MGISCRNQRASTTLPLTPLPASFNFRQTMSKRNLLHEAHAIKPGLEVRCAADIEVAGVGEIPSARDDVWADVAEVVG